MRARHLRHKILIEQVTETRDGFGDIVQTWTTYSTRRAEVEPLNGREYFDSKSVQADVTIRFRIRYLKDITPKMRINYDSRYFDIQSIINVKERKRELVLMCKESV